MRIETVALCGLVLALLYPGSASAVTVFKCIGDGGQVAYQDLPCPLDATENRLRLAPAGQAQAPQESTAPSKAEGTDEAPAEPVVAASRIPLDPLYDCERPDGSHYTSTSGIPTQHLVPLGALGYPPPSLSDTYGGTRRQRMQRADPTTRAGARAARNALVAGMSVWVEDQCRRLGRKQVCEHFKAEYDRVHHERRSAFQATRATLEAQERDLKAMLLDNC